MQQDGKTLKESADLLAINYSTAKTIVQTFRRERRIAKKPKRFVETRKAIQKEKFLERTLVKHHVAALVAQALQDELFLAGVDEKKLAEESKEVSAAANTKETGDVEEGSATLGPHKGIPRVYSAPQMVLVQAEEEGPKEGQVSRAVGVREDMLLPASRKEVFYVYPESSLDEEYKNKINYDDPVELRTKLRSPNETPELKTPLPSLRMALPLPTFCQSFAGPRPQQQTEVVRDDTFTVDFAAYRHPIAANPFRKYNFHFLNAIIGVHQCSSPDAHCSFLNS